MTVGRVDGAEDIELDPMRLHQARRPDDPREDRLPASVTAEGVVERPRAVETQADEKPVIVEKPAPGFVDEHAVRLDRGAARWPGRACLLPASTALRKKSRPMSVGSPPCQAIGTSEAGWTRHGLADVGLHDIVRHPEARAGIKAFLRKVEAVVAAAVALGPRGLGHDVECGSGCHFLRSVSTKRRASSSESP